MIIACNTKKFFTDRWDFVWPDTPASLEKEPLSIVLCGHVDSGKRTTTGCLLFEPGGIPERELDKLKQDEERLEKSSLVYVFFMARQKEEWDRGMNTTCNTNEFFTDKWQLHHHRYSWPQRLHQECNKRLGQNDTKVQEKSKDRHGSTRDRAIFLG